MSACSEMPVKGWAQITNSNFGNRCVICGGFFDEGGICNNGHEQGKIYYIPPKANTTEKPAFTKPDKNTDPDPTIIVCKANGNRCVICGGMFGDGDDVCGLGQHQIGQAYER